MKSSIKREVTLLINMVLDEEWEIKDIIKPTLTMKEEKQKEINWEKDLIVVFKKD
jgi:hypothetical protein